MIKDIKKSKEQYDNFIKQCVKELKELKVCYVFKPEQVEELKKRYDKELIIEKNECGYTIKVKR